MIAQKFAVIGIGLFGKAIAKTLARKGAEVLAIDVNPEITDAIADSVSFAVALDATDKKALLSQDIQHFDAVIVSIGQNFEQRLLCSSLLIDLGVKRIIARAMGKNQRIILEKMGIKEILSPENEVGAIVAERLLNPNIVSYLQFPDDYRIAELKAPQRIAYRSVEDLNLRDNYKLSLITIKKEIEVLKDNKIIVEQHIEGVPSTKTVILPNDCLVLFGKNRDIERFVEINQ